MKGYPTDEELNLLIEQLEEQELYAPKHLKEEIMNKVFSKQTERARPKHKSGRMESITLFTYRLKIIAGMAAALIMLILIPFQAGTGAAPSDTVRQQRSEAAEEKYRNSNGSSVNSLLNEGTRRIDDTINSWLGITEEYPINNLFEMMNGGNHYEN